MKAPASVATVSSGPRYFLLDCRPADEFEQARFPTSFHLNPELLLNPEELAAIIVAFQDMKVRYERAH